MAFPCYFSNSSSRDRALGQRGARCESVPSRKPSCVPAPGRSCLLHPPLWWEPREEAESPCAVPLAGCCCWRDAAHSHLTHSLFLAQPAAGSSAQPAVGTMPRQRGRQNPALNTEENSSQGKKHLPVCGKPPHTSAGKHKGCGVSVLTHPQLLCSPAVPVPGGD